MIPKRIRALLDAEPFMPFSLYMIDHHSIHIGDPSTACFEDDGRTLVVQTTVLKDTYIEAVNTLMITRLLVKAPTPVAEFPLTEETFDVQPVQPIALRKTRVLFICTHNSARSQMAEAWMRHLGGEQIDAESAGFEPGELHPLAVEAMHEVGIDISAQRAKRIFEVYRSGALFAVTISVCDESVEKTPTFPGQTERLHWSIPDPLAGDDGSDAAILSRMRSARESLRERIEAWLSEIAIGHALPS